MVVISYARLGITHVNIELVILQSMNFNLSNAYMQTADVYELSYKLNLVTGVKLILEQCKQTPTFQSQVE